MRSALLVGATGLVRGLCFQMLLEDDTYDRVIALTRKRAKRENLLSNQRRFELVRKKIQTILLFCL